MIITFIILASRYYLKLFHNKMSKSFSYLDNSFLLPHGYKFNEKIFKSLRNSLTKVKYEDKNSKKSFDLACKIFDRKKRPKNENYVDILKSLKHSNIVTIYSIFQNNNLMYIFTLWASRENLLDHIRTHGHVDELQGKAWFLQMLSALKYLHDMRVAHCNLSCKNILLTSSLQIKIGCLNNLKLCHKNAKIIVKVKKSMPAVFLPPEINSRQPHDPLKADIFSLGVILL